MIFNCQKEEKMATARKASVTTKGRRAALKSWETRRKSELKRKRSEAAKKAWEIRRANS